MNEWERFMVFENEMIKLKNDMRLHPGTLIGNSLIDFYDDDFFTEVVIKADENLYRLVSGFYRNDINYVSIILGLVVVALKNYDGSFWPHVHDSFNKSYQSGYSEAYIDGKARTVIKKFFGNEATSDRQISSVIKNAIVPVNYLGNYFELMFDIYCKNFYKVLEDDDATLDDLSLVFKGISGVSYEDDNYRSEATNKSYILIKTARDIMKDKKHVTELLKMSLSVLKIIDSYYHSIECDLLDNKYFKAGFDSWISKHKDKTELKYNPHEKFNGEYIRAYTTPSLSLHNNDIYLAIPTRKVSLDYDYKKIRIVIYNGKEVLCELASHEIVIEQEIGVYLVKVPNQLKIKKPLGALRYEIVCGNEIVYNSTDKLFRDYIFFTSNGAEFKNNKNPQGSLWICFNNENNTSISVISKKDFYSVGSFDPNKNGYIYINGNPIVIGKMIVSGLIGEKYNSEFLFWEDDKIDVWKNVDRFMFETDIDRRRIAISINGIDKPLSSMNYTVIKNGDRSSYDIECTDLVLGINNIIAYDVFDKHTIDKCNHWFVIDPYLEYSVSEYEDGKHVLRFKNYEHPEGVSKILDSDYPQTLFPKVTINDGEEGYEYNYFMDLGFHYYKIGNGKYRKHSEDLWHKSISTNSVLYSMGFYYEKINVVSPENELLSEIPGKDELLGSSALIGSIVTFRNYPYVDLLFIRNGEEVETLRCYNKCMLDQKKTRIKYDPATGIFKANIHYHGLSSLMMIITSKSRTFSEQRVLIDENPKSFKLSGLPEFEPILIEIKENQTGISLKKKENVLYSKTHVFYNLDHLVGRTIRLSKMNYTQYTKNRVISSSINAKDTFVEILEKLNSNTYTCNIYNRTSGFAYYMQKINPVKILLISEVPYSESLIDVAFTTMEDDGLLIDRKRCTVLNADESMTANDIDTAVLDLAK